MSGGVLIVSGGVWMVSGWCLDGVWMVSGSGLRVFGDVLIPNLLATILHHGTQILPLILVPCIA